jgi:hypothetical protein
MIVTFYVYLHARTHTHTHKHTHTHTLGRTPLNSEQPVAAAATHTTSTRDEL